MLGVAARDAMFVDSGVKQIRIFEHDDKERWYTVSAFRNGEMSKGTVVVLVY